MVGVIGVAERTVVRLPDRIGIGVLTSAFPPELVLDDSLGEDERGRVRRSR